MPGRSEDTHGSHKAVIEFIEMIFKMVCMQGANHFIMSYCKEAQGL